MRFLLNVARAFALVCVCFAITSSVAQYRGSIRGVVTDPQGAVVPGATVTLTNKETGQAFTTTSDEAGIYNFNALPPSHYAMTVEKDGFKKKNNHLALDDILESIAELRFYREHFIKY